MGACSVMIHTKIIILTSTERIVAVVSIRLVLDTRLADLNTYAINI